jgi:hypothetical protein
LLSPLRRPCQNHRMAEVGYALHDKIDTPAA